LATGLAADGDEGRSPFLRHPIVMTNIPSKVLDAERHGLGFTTLAWAAIGVCVVVEVGILVSRRRFASFFADFDMQLPVVARFVVGPVLPLWLAFVILGAIIKEFVPGLSPARDKCNVTILLVGLACLAIYVFGTLPHCYR
jgi:hypothetical protein